MVQNLRLRITKNEINAATFNQINNAQEKITHWLAENDYILV